MVLVAALVLLDVGSPVLFWQQRLGKNGQVFLVYKFRTLRPLFADNGQPIPLQDRLSFIGHLLRKTRLDELPQLMNVLVGDMSLIGPRPLLPRISQSIRLSGWPSGRGSLAGRRSTAESFSAVKRMSSTTGMFATHRFGWICALCCAPSACS